MSLRILRVPFGVFNYCNHSVVAVKKIKRADYLPLVGGAHSSQCPQVGQVSPGAIAIDLAATGAASATGDLAAAAACRVNAVMVCAIPVDSWEAEVFLKPAPRSSEVPSAKRPSAASCDALSPQPQTAALDSEGAVRIFYLSQCLCTYTPTQKCNGRDCHCHNQYFFHNVSSSFLFCQSKPSRRISFVRLAAMYNGPCSSCKP